MVDTWQRAARLLHAVCLANDLVYFAMDPGELENVLVLLGLRRGVERKVMIAGATLLCVSSVATVVWHHQRLIAILP